MAPKSPATFIKLWLPVIAWAGLIFLLSAQPDLRITPEKFWDTILRKLAHMFVFGVLFLLSYRALGWKKALGAFAFVLLYAISDEWHQHFVRGRHAAPMDVAIDMAGTIVAWFSQRLVRKKW